MMVVVMVKVCIWVGLNFVVIVVEIGRVLLILRLVKNCRIVIVVIFGENEIRLVVILNMKILLMMVRW